MSIEYDDYLAKHKTNVAKAFEWLETNLPQLAERDNAHWELARWNCTFGHDASKSQDDEYKPYDAYFYGGNRSYNVVQNYNFAWLLHLHRNPHHWQYWVLINDDPKEGERILEMPYEYIIEMICDWWSFSWANDNLYEIFKWYDEHKYYIKLGNKTRKTVEDILSQIRNKLDELAANETDELQHHGTKGMKWGVKNGPPYPIDKSKKKTDNVVNEAINSGKVSKTINKELQSRHNESTHEKGKSYLYGNDSYAQQLVDKLSGTGTPVFDSKTGTHIYPRKDVKE